MTDQLSPSHVIRAVKSVGDEDRIAIVEDIQNIERNLDVLHPVFAQKLIADRRIPRVVSGGVFAIGRPCR